MKKALTGAVLSIPVGSTVNALMEKDPVEKKDSVVNFNYFKKHSRDKRPFSGATFPHEQHKVSVKKIPKT